MVAAIAAALDTTRAGVTARGAWAQWYGFFAYDTLHAAMRAAIRAEPFAEATIPILAPEHLLVCKAIFNRPKDWLDIEQILVTVADLDAAEILSWLDRVLGADDPRSQCVVAALAAGR